MITKLKTINNLESRHNIQVIDDHLMVTLVADSKVDFKIISCSQVWIAAEFGSFYRTVDIVP